MAAAVTAPPEPPPGHGLRLERHVCISADGANAVTLLSEASGLSRARIKPTMTRGAVWLSRGRRTRHLRRATKRLQRGDTLHLYYDERILERTPPAPQLVCDAGAYSVWNKPRGMFSQGSRWGDHCTIARWAEQHLSPQRPAFPVHRLDRAASGLIVVAHSKQAAAALHRLFHDRKVEKRYRVQVHGAFPTEPVTLDAPLDGRSARSQARRLHYDPERDRSELEVRIESGRKHQIRRHLAAHGHPLVGDRLYGHGDEDEDLQLQACHLAFPCPLTQRERVFTLPAATAPP